MRNLRVPFCWIVTDKIIAASGLFTDAGRGGVRACADEAKLERAGDNVFRIVDAEIFQRCFLSRVIGHVLD